MTAQQGFSIEVSSRFEGWWRYNVALMCGCFDADDHRTDFATAESHVADVGSNLTAPPAGIEADRRVVLTTPPCHHALCYIYLIPHALPADNGIASARPFEIELRIGYAGKKLRTEKRLINQWSGASIEMRLDAPEV